ncbi:COX assembly mitochondrial protein [[Candida] railenensis]|uniref:COX assembly mitochondrial protein n=1 Tax=[Candida] railenensis TaxID=45579 RepID=A0A9P0QM59_9ASCO|nr:COX assembly mitochondrial protein [[Candida] railenensis]
MNSKKTLEDVHLPTNPNIPAWLITPKEEKLIYERWRKKAHVHCDDLIRQYIECSNRFKNPIDGMRECKGINSDRESCLKQFQKDNVLDNERNSYIEEKIEMKKIIDEYVKKRDG